ncbi:MAG: RNA polymerase sigma-70 factor [Tannerella sp.]|jgi:RNA polymerase sigma-70 factor (ECF subfamily)|nr:RNA polymerase sigma-70 factor [Tannerella sp.]
MNRALLISEQLLLDLNEGDRRAFRMFYDVTYPLVCQYVRLFIAQPDDCKDVVSEVFYLVWKNRETMLTVRDINSWLFTICRNEAFKMLKNKAKFKVESIDDMPVELEIAEDEDYIDDEMREIYRNAVNGLPPRCKMIFLLAKEENMKYKKIAELLNITEGTVTQQVNIAIKKITETVRKRYNDGRDKNTKR